MNIPTITLAQAQDSRAYFQGRADDLSEDIERLRLAYIAIRNTYVAMRDRDLQMVLVPIAADLRNSMKNARRVRNDNLRQVSMWDKTIEEGLKRGIITR